MRNPSEQVVPAPEQGLNTDSGVMPDLQKAYHQDERKQSGVIVTSELPPNLVEVLKCFDQDGDGNLDLEEIAEAARVYQATKDKAKMYKKVAIALFGLLCAYTAVLGGMIFAIVDAMKDNENQGGAMLDRKTGAVVGTKTATETLSGLEVHWDLVKAPPSNLYETYWLSYSGAQGVVEHGKVDGWETYESTDKQTKRILARFTNGKGLVMQDQHISATVKLPADELNWVSTPLEHASAEARRLAYWFHHATRGMILMGR